MTNTVKNDLAVDLEVVGCIPDEQVATADGFDPPQYVQVLIGMLDWIERF